MKQFRLIAFVILLTLVSSSLAQASLLQTPEQVTGYKLPWPLGLQYQTTGVRTAHDPSDGVTPRQAIDFGLPLNTPVLAMRGGDIVLSKDIGGATNGYVVIDHNNGYCSAYVHLSTLEYGEVTNTRISVSQGQQIGLSGRLSTNGAIHLHVAVYSRTGSSCDGYSNTDKTHEAVIIFDEVGRELNYNDYPTSSNAVEQSPSSYVFIDVQPGSPAFWAVQEIEEIYFHGFTNGCDSNGVPYVNLPFCPEQELIRAQMALFILRLKYGSDYEPSGSYKGYFIDVDDHPWRLWFEKLYEDGITAGCNSDGIPYETLEFCPEDPVPRLHMAAFLARAENWGLSPATGVFDDMPNDDEFTRAAEYMWWQGYTNGCGGDGLKFCPDDIVTRAHLAVFLARVAGLVEVYPRCASLVTHVSPQSAGSINIGLAPDCPINPTLYQLDSLIELTTTPAVLHTNANYSYGFSHWSGDLSGSDQINTLSVGHDQKSVTAHFVLLDNFIYIPLVKNEK